MEDTRMSKSTQQEKYKLFKFRFNPDSTININ